ncbi:MAG: amino acid ABC transporter substrate-binding protein [Treponema sp.]|nr:amino acid ABC transporter substrate-binding protein [Treponema sp.]
MKKTVLGICLAVMAGALVFAGGAKDKAASGEDTSLLDLQKRGVFVLGLDDSFPPLGFRDDANKIVGYDIDLAQEVSRRLGVTFKAQPIEWDAKEQELATGKIDCIWNGFTITKERQAALEFTKAYLNNAQVVVVRKGDGVTALADLKGKKVAVQAGSSAQEAIDSNPAFKESLKELVMFKDNLTALNDLETYGVDGVVMDSVVANYSITVTGKPFAVLSEGLANEEYGIAFRKGDVQLRDAVQKILEDMQKDGTVTAISTKWFGADISVIGK